MIGSQNIRDWIVISCAVSFPDKDKTPLRVDKERGHWRGQCPWRAGGSGESSHSPAEWVWRFLCTRDALYPLMGSIFFVCSGQMWKEAAHCTQFSWVCRGLVSSPHCNAKPPDLFHLDLFQAFTLVVEPPPNWIETYQDSQSSLWKSEGFSRILLSFPPSDKAARLLMVFPLP